MMLRTSGEVQNLPTLRFAANPEKVAAQYTIQAFGVKLDTLEICGLCWTGWGATVVERNKAPYSFDWQWGGLDDRFPDGPIFTSEAEAEAYVLGSQGEPVKQFGCLACGKPLAPQARGQYCKAHRHRSAAQKAAVQKSRAKALDK